MCLWNPGARSRWRRDERTETNWTKMEKTNDISKRKSGSVKLEKMVCVHLHVGHHDRTGAVVCITKNGVVRLKNWTRQPLNDAWDATNRGGLCGTPWHMVALESRLTKKVTAVKDGAGPTLPGIVVESNSRG